MEKVKRCSPALLAPKARFTYDLFAICQANQIGTGASVAAFRIIEPSWARHLHCTTPALPLEEHRDVPPEGHRDDVAGGARERTICLRFAKQIESGASVWLRPACPPRGSRKCTGIIYFAKAGSAEPRPVARGCGGLSATRFARFAMQIESSPKQPTAA